MTLRAIVLALVAATVLGALATDAVVRSPKGPCNDVEPVDQEGELSFVKQTRLSGKPVIVATAGRRVDKSFGGYEYELGPMKLDCESAVYAGNDAHQSTYDSCIVRPMNACHASSGMRTGYMFSADGSILERDPATDTHVLRMRSDLVVGVGTMPFKIVQGTRPPTSLVPVVVIWLSLAIAIHAVIVLRRRERTIATLHEGVLDESGRVQPKGGGPAFAAAPHGFKTGDDVTFAAPPREPTYRAEDVVPIFPSLLVQRNELKAIRFRAWFAMLFGLVLSTFVALIVR